MTESQESIVRRQFGTIASAYVTSAVHAEGADLDHVEAVARDAAPAQALDLGAGGGHVSYRLARHAGRVVACDLSADMIAAIGAEATARGIGRIEGVVAAAEALPFADDSFDMLACRFSAHHWRDLDAGLREARRVLKPGAPAIFIDAVAPEHPQADVHLQAIELLRDTSHGRDYRVSEWIAALGRAGFVVQNMGMHRLRMDFASWTARMRTPDVHVAAIRSLQRAASADVASHFGLEEDGSFMLDVMTVDGV